MTLSIDAPIFSTGLLGHEGRPPSELLTIGLCRATYCLSPSPPVKEPKLVLPSIGPFFARTAFVEVCGESLVPDRVLSRGQLLPADDGFWPLAVSELT